MNRDDFQQLADGRIQDAEVLIASGRWSAAYYLAGYAVECALKACIAKLTSQFDFPNKKLVNDSYTHDILKLVATANLESIRSADAQADPNLDANWQIVKDWTEGSRYIQWSQAQSEELFNAVTDNTNGVLQWIKLRW